MLKLNYVLFLFFFVVLHSFGQDQWRPFGSDDYNQAYYGESYAKAVAFDRNNIPYAVFTDISYSQNTTTYLSVRRFINNHWEFVGQQGFVTSNGGLDIAIDNNNIPYIAYRSGNTFYVQKFSGTEWVNLGSQNYNCYSPQLAVDAQNNVYLAGSFGLGTPSVRMFNGTSWSTVGTTAINTSNCAKISIALSPGGIPYVAFDNISMGYKLSVKKLNGTVWENVGSENFSANSAANISLKLSGSGVPYVVYTYINPNNNMYGYNKIDTFNGSAWETLWSLPTQSENPVLIGFDSDDVLYRTRLQGVYTITESLNGTTWTPVGTSFAGKPVKLVFDAENKPSVLYKNGLPTALKRYIDGNWGVIGETDLSGYGDSIFGSLSGGSQNDFYYLYGDNATNILHVKKWIDGQWIQIGQDLPGIDGPMKIQVGPQGVPYIFYQSANNSLLIKKYNGTEWIDAAPSITAEPKNAMVDTDGTIYVMQTPTVNFQTTIKINKYAVGANSWSSLNNLNLTFYSGQISLESYDGYLYFACINQQHNLLIKKISTSGDTWTSESPENGISDGNAQTPQLKKGPDGIYIVYGDLSNNVNKVTVEKLNNSTWEPVGNKQFSKNGDAYPVLYFDHSGAPYVAFSNGSTAYGQGVFKFSNGLWEQLGGNRVNASNASNNSPLTMAFFTNNTPILAYGCMGLFAKYYGPQDPLATLLSSQNDNRLIVYPNPVKDRLYISGEPEAERAEIYDISGKKVFDGAVSENTLNISLNRGIYILKVYDRNGMAKARKFIKE